MECVGLPRTLKRIEYCAFQGCKNLKGIILPERLEYIGDRCFEESALTLLCCPPALKTIKSQAFRQCENLENIKFSHGLENIGRFAFLKTGVKDVELPGSLRRIAQGVFAQCEHLKTVKFRDGLEVLGADECLNAEQGYYGVFQESAVEHVELPSTLKRIEYSAFQSCKSLQHIRLPERLECLGKRCFKESALESIWFPPALKIIE